MIRTRSQMEEVKCDKCHDGNGTLLLHSLINTGDSDHSLIFMHDDVLPPGVSIGEHRHDGSEEVYFVAEGHGTLIMDHQNSPVGPGDVSLVKSGHSHGIINSGKTNMRLIVVGFKTN
jgi:mannose-6-phosphate isomerase-like protein (cupin superfamily)